MVRGTQVCMSLQKLATTGFDFEVLFDFYSEYLNVFPLRNLSKILFWEITNSL